MTREHTVAVKSKGGSVTHCAGDRFAISLKSGEVKSVWADGSPITKSEFDAVLAPTGLFEIAEQPPAKPAAEKKGA